MTSTHTVDTAKVPAKQAKPAKAPVTDTAPAWYAAYNARISNPTDAAGKPLPAGVWGTPLTADEAKVGPLLAGPGKSKRTSGDAAEALMLSLIMRPAGVGRKQYLSIRTSGGASMNCVNYASVNLPRARFGWVHVTFDGDNVIGRLTPNGRARMLAESGVKAAVLDRMCKPYVASTPKAPAAPKATKPATDKAPKAPRKPASKATKPADAPKPVTGTTAPATAKPISEPAKPVQGTPAPQGTIPAPVKAAVTQATGDLVTKATSHTPSNPNDPSKVN